MKKHHADTVNDILQNYHFNVENNGINDTFNLGMRLLAFHSSIKGYCETETEYEIGKMIDDCRRGIIPKPASCQSDVMYL